MVEYLKKKAIYGIASELMSAEIPPCKDFIYSFYRGVEWLQCDHIRICSQGCGKWISIQQEHYDESRDEYNTELDIYSRPVNGKYTYHSHNGKQVIIDKIKNTEGQNYEQSNSNRKSEGWSEQDSIHGESRGRTR